MKTIINPNYSYHKSTVEISDLIVNFPYPHKGTWVYHYILTLMEKHNLNPISKEEWMKRNPSMAHLVDETISKEEWNKTKNDYLHIDDFWDLKSQQKLIDLYNQEILKPFIEVEDVSRGKYLGGTFDKGVSQGGGGKYELILNGAPLPDYLEGYVYDWDMSSPNRFHLGLKSEHAKGHYVYRKSIDVMYQRNYCLIVSELL